MNKDTLIEALWIAKDNFDYDGEYAKANQVESYINELKTSPMSEETYCEVCLENFTDDNDFNHRFDYPVCLTCADKKELV